jgi:hypothetical protein
MNPIQDFIKENNLANPCYLGDGLYSANDGFQVLLFCERMTTLGPTVHFVALDSSVIKSLLLYLKEQAYL